jgi:transglutaminase-like putative cysteine protease
MRVYRITLNDIPPYRKERYMPSLPEVAPFVVFTSMRDWDSLYRWYAALVRDRMRSSGEMKSKVRELVREGIDERAVIKKIFDHVSGAVRYVGFEFGIGGVQPRPADLTYRTGMGDCKDMSLVLAAMLREAGLDARIAGAYEEQRDS